MKESEDLVSAESQSAQDTDDFRTPDSEDGGSTDVSNPYRDIRWTDRETRPTQPEVDPEAGQEEEGPTSAFPTSSPPAQLPARNPSTHPFQTPDPVTVLGSRGEAAIYPEADDAEPTADDPHRITLPPYDALSEFDDDDAQEEEVEDTYSPHNPTNVPTPGYRPASERSSYPPDSPSPELMGLGTGEPDDFSQ